MAIKHWPADERPREKLRRHGAQALSNAECLAILLRTGTAGHSALDIARQALAQAGGIGALLRASEAEFCLHRGLGQAAYCQCHAALELASRCLQENLQHEATITSPRQCNEFLAAKLAKRTEETFACIFLDSRHRVLHYQELFHGTIHTTEIHPRIIVQQALKHNAAAVIFAHNHPSGCATPSDADIELTQSCQKLLKSLDINLLDHIIIGDGDTVSLQEHGVM